MSNADAADPIKEQVMGELTDYVKPKGKAGRPKGSKTSPFSKSRMATLKVEQLAQAIAKDTVLGSVPERSPFLENLGIVNQKDKETLYRIAAATVDNFNAMLKAQLGLAASKLTAKMASDEYVESLKPGEVAFATNIALQSHAKIGATGLTSGHINQVNVFLGPGGRTREQVMRALQGLPEEPSEVKVTPTP